MIALGTISLGTMQQTWRMYGVRLPMATDAAPIGDSRLDGAVPGGLGELYPETRAIKATRATIDYCNT